MDKKQMTTVLTTLAISIVGCVVYDFGKNYMAKSRAMRTIDAIEKQN